ncbi:polysaccharide deacetylase family protein [Aquabacterium sp. A7-Y]|uniref:polysaccharide deacetylase family protein n=1 Tax=Aquabacterium sp. A7-Y TaxID=1349605 RepID=UPI00223D5401|nr:polysaccharide deacetylase family protein [Aquabacterium sp. A7-Y]MCW7537506.1 polysaccharide deacetylase family protein [Aquabacterium sp. A7-Y]
MTAGIGRLAGSVYRFAAGRPYPGGPRTRLPVLMYHRVVARPDPLLTDVPDAAELADQLRVLSQVFTVLPLEEAADRLQAGTLPARAACITFDDGYRDNYEIALPLLKQFGLTATFFVATGFIDGGRMFNDTVVECVRRLNGRSLDLSGIGLGQRSASDDRSRIALAEDIVQAIKYVSLERREEVLSDLTAQVNEPLPDNLMMTPEQVRSMARQGMTVGGHTSRHPILAKLDPAEAEREIFGSRDTLVSLLDEPPRCFAYPNGRPYTDYTAEHIDMVRRAGYRCAVSTAWGVAERHTDRFQLPRFGPMERHPAVFVARLMRMSSHHQPRLVTADPDRPAPSAPRSG